ncbi:MAG TPA: hypothetical protein VMU18_00015 [Rhodoblastus sp.]|nr:hypothetical protein [Rhodoblastus sp.]
MHTEDSRKVEMVKDYPKQVFPDPPERPPEYVAYLEKATVALRSLRLIVFPALGAFILLAAYGFFLIYLLTSDARTMANQTRLMVGEMQAISGEMRAITTVMGDMRGNVGDMRTSLEEMNRHMAAMESSTSHMAATVALIQHSARNLDASVGPAMGMMNNFMPFGAGGNSWPGAPPFAPPPR